MDLDPRPRMRTCRCRMPHTRTAIPRSVPPWCYRWHRRWPGRAGSTRPGRSDLAGGAGTTCGRSAPRPAGRPGRRRRGTGRPGRRRRAAEPAREIPAGSSHGTARRLSGRGGPPPGSRQPHDRAAAVAGETGCPGLFGECCGGAFRIAVRSIPGKRLTCRVNSARAQVCISPPDNGLSLSGPCPAAQASQRAAKPLAPYPAAFRPCWPAGMPPPRCAIPP